MLTDFRILMESTFTFKGGKLYLMLLRDDAKYGVEVVNRTKSFGRKYTKGRDEADLLYDFAIKRFNRCKNIKDAEKTAEDIFSLKSTDKMLFALFVDGDTLTQADIVYLNKKINFKTRLKFDYERRKRKIDALTIYIYADGDRKPFGLLVGTCKADDLKFELL